MNPISKKAAEYGITPSNADNNKELVKAIVRGEEGAINRFIESNMAYVTTKVQAFLDKCPQYN